jgi:bacillithiol system protein YtxJ
MQGVYQRQNDLKNDKMSVFSNLFGSSEKQDNSNNKINWIPLSFMGQLDELVAFSNEKPSVIFKHSTRCSISRFALKQFENEYDLGNSVDAYFLDLLEHRDISNEIASRFGVYHQSPQLLLIKSGKSVYDVSHSDIDAGELKGKV